MRGTDAPPHINRFAHLETATASMLASLKCARRSGVALIGVRAVTQGVSSRDRGGSRHTLMLPGEGQARMKPCKGRGRRARMKACGWEGGGDRRVYQEA